MELASLLQELLKKGWKVYWVFDKLMTFWQDWWTPTFWFWVLWEVRYSIRELVSKESGLWQFVCENKMIRITERNSLCNWLYWEEIYYDETQTEKIYKNYNYEYRLIESALCDEKDLEKFLLDNIKVDE